MFNLRLLKLTLPNGNGNIYINIDRISYICNSARNTTIVSLDKPNTSIEVIEPADDIIDIIYSNLGKKLTLSKSKMELYASNSI